MLNKSKGNMYPFVTHTWNVIKGKCPHDCSYCYMKQFKQNPIRFDKKEMKTDLGEGNFIFVGSSCDMWAWNINLDWIGHILDHCYKFDKNKYLFQSKNPERFRKFYGYFPDQTIFGTTLESNREYRAIYRGAPRIMQRCAAISMIGGREDGEEVMVTIEPILDFDMKEFVDMIYDIEPTWVNIGADSKGHNLPEPPAEKILALIEELKTFTNVRIKRNLRRIDRHSKIN